MDRMWSACVLDLHTGREEVSDAEVVVEYWKRVVVGNCSM